MKVREGTHKMKKGYVFIIVGTLKKEVCPIIEEEMELREEVEDGGRKVLSGFYFLRDDGYMAI